MIFGKKKINKKVYIKKKRPCQEIVIINTLPEFKNICSQKYERSDWCTCVKMKNITQLDHCLQQASNIWCFLPLEATLVIEFDVEHENLSFAT